MEEPLDYRPFIRPMKQRGKTGSSPPPLCIPHGRLRAGRKIKRLGASAHLPDKLNVPGGSHFEEQNQLRTNHRNCKLRHTYRNRRLLELFFKPVPDQVGAGNQHSDRSDCSDQHRLDPQIQQDGEKNRSAENLGNARLSRPSERVQRHSLEKKRIKTLRTYSNSSNIIQTFIRPNNIIIDHCKVMFRNLPPQEEAENKRYALELENILQRWRNLEKAGQIKKLEASLFVDRIPSHF